MDWGKASGAGRSGHVQSVSKQWASAAGREGSAEEEMSVLKNSSCSEHMRKITAFVALGGFGCIGDAFQMHSLLSCASHWSMWPLWQCCPLSACAFDVW